MTGFAVGVGLVLVVVYGNRGVPGAGIVALVLALVAAYAAGRVRGKRGRRTVTATATAVSQSTANATNAVQIFVATNGQSGSQIGIHEGIHSDNQSGLDVARSIGGAVGESYRIGGTELTADDVDGIEDEDVIGELGTYGIVSNTRPVVTERDGWQECSL